MQQKWADDNPFFLMIINEDRTDNIRIDLGEAGWSQTYGGWMRQAGTWYLCRKTNGQVALAMTVIFGEQPYYTRRHVGQVGQGGGISRETSCFGIGKKRLDGHVDRMWILPDLITVCAGDDAEALAMEVVKTLEWQQQASPSE